MHGLSWQIDEKRVLMVSSVYMFKFLSILNTCLMRFYCGNDFVVDIICSQPEYPCIAGLLLVEGTVFVFLYIFYCFIKNHT